MTDMARNNTIANFTPNWVSPPGETILDLLDEREWTQQQLADRLGYTLKHVNQLIKAKVPLTDDAAVRLQNVLGASVGFWLTREAQYREQLALAEAAEKQIEMVPWLERFPLKDLMGAGVLSKRRIDAKSKPIWVGELLGFFGVASPEQWQSEYGCMELAFRRSREDQADIAAITTWLRMGERKAEKMEGPAYSEVRFKAGLNEIKALTCLGKQGFELRMRQILNEAGVAFVVLPALPRTHVSGVARWLNPHRPLIQLSLYGKQNDRFWFSFFHEAAHILLHSKQKKSVFLDDSVKSEVQTREEQEANEWARDFLISIHDAKQLASLPKTKLAVQRFANSIGVHPGIVVGRMQNEQLLDPGWLNEFKESIIFKE